MVWLAGLRRQPTHFQRRNASTGRRAHQWSVDGDGGMSWVSQ